MKALALACPARLQKEARPGEVPLGLDPEVKNLTAAAIWAALANTTEACAEGQLTVRVGGCARVRQMAAAARART